MTIPVTAKQFERWLNEHKASWPADLQVLGDQAYRAIWRVDNNPPHINNALEEINSGVWRKDMQAIMAFAEAYGVWTAVR